jgi:hypothetical protein
MSYKINTNINVSDIIEPGSTNTNSYVGFPAYNTSNLAFERHISNFGYSVSNTDFKDSIVALYNDYYGGNWTNNSSTYNGTINTNSGSGQNDNQPNNATYQAYYAYGKTVTASGTIPSWCTKVRVIVIGAGGGGGGGGTNSGNQAGSGGGGGSGGLAAGMITVVGGQTFSISLGGCGRGGFYEGTANSNGFNANNPDSNETTFTYSASSSVIQANVGGAGDGGPRGEASNEASGAANGGNGAVNTTNVADYYQKTGSAGNAGNDRNPGESAGITRDDALPTLNTNQGDAPNSSMINQDNQLPGIGQGGWGGINANNSNGYGGQCGGRSFVRVYFIR